MPDWSFNGTAAATLDCFVEEDSSATHAPTAGTRVVSVFGGLKGYLTPRTIDGRTLTLRAGLITDDNLPASREAVEDALKQLLMVDDVVTIRRTGPGSIVREIEGMCVQFQPAQVTPATISPKSVATMRFVCADARWADPTSQTVTFAATATDYDVDLGSAPSDGVITIVGPATNPVVTVKDGTGAAQITLTFTTSLAGSSNSLVIDLNRREIELVTSGTASAGIQTLTSGVWPFQFERAWYDGVNPPTIRISAGAATSALVYTKRYW